MATLSDDLTPLDPDFVQRTLTSWQERTPTDADALARRWLAAKQDGLVDDDDLAVLMAVTLGDPLSPEAAERLQHLVLDGWCRHDDTPPQLV
jgi:hypothetical protein